ncbi:MAG: HsdR family type I site-specific deoxyribonuclease [Candidatus Aenigmatarchaeota archaeon]
MLQSTEKTLVENYLIQKLQEKGWSYKKSEELNRETYEEPLLVNNLTEAIKRINKYINLSERDINKVIDELKGKIPGSETAKKILNFLKDGVPIKLEKTKELKYINLIDYENFQNNEFIVSSQVKFSGRVLIITDIVLFINGIPLALFECKDPTNPSVSWEDAYRQIKSYEKDCEELFKYVQIGVAAEEKVRYFPIVPWLDEVKPEVWREEGKNEIDSIVEMLSPTKMLDLIKNFIFIRTERGKTTRVVARYMQYRAANRIFERVVNTLQGKENKDKGLIWHWQGSGKTLTMIFAAYKLYMEKLLENPTIFFIIDRIELQEQLFEEIAALDLGIKPEKIESKEELKKALLHDEGMGKRGFIVTLIHKFNQKDLLDVQQFLEKELKGRESILTRRNIIVFVDESHRTQYGALAAQMREILKNAFFFGFTGTPISKKGRDTFIIFAYPEDKDLYLDKYFIRESVEDGFTLCFSYQLAPDKLRLNKKQLDEFLAQKEEEIPSEIKKKINEKLSKIKILMENRERIEGIAKHITDHFKENVDGKFKAIIVAVSRKACIYYKEALDNLIPPEYSEIVMTYERTDPKEILEYSEKLKKRFKKEQEDINKEIIRKFKDEEFPKILIVTDMLLTGFDAPILQVMYLDKPLKGHRLLQAIARTNRPLPRKAKKCGLIIDYVGVLKELNKALAFYSKIEKEDLNCCIKSFSDYEKEFLQLIEKMKEIIGDVEVKFDDKEYFNKIIFNLVLRNKEKEFVDIFKELRKSYEFLGPSKVKIDYKEYFKFLTALYTLYKKMRGEEENIDELKKIYKRFVEEIYKSTEFESIVSFPEIKIDENYIEKIEKNLKTTESRVFNRLTVIRHILKEKPHTPLYEDISHNIEELFKMWKNRTIELEEFYEKLKNIHENLITTEKRKQELKLNDIEYSILSILEKEKRFKERKDLAKKVKELNKKIESKLFSGWEFKRTVISDISKEIRMFLIEMNNLSKKERDDLCEKIIQALKSYY